MTDATEMPVAAQPKGRRRSRPIADGKGRIATSSASTEIIDLGHYRGLKNSSDEARRKKISTCIHFEISASGEATTLIPTIDSRDAIAVIAFCTELANQMFDMYYDAPCKRPMPSRDEDKNVLSVRDRLARIGQEVRHD